MSTTWQETRRLHRLSASTLSGIFLLRHELVCNVALSIPPFTTQSEPVAGQTHECERRRGYRVIPHVKRGEVAVLLTSGDTLARLRLVCVKYVACACASASPCRAHPTGCGIALRPKGQARRPRRKVIKGSSMYIVNDYRGRRRFGCVSHNSHRHE